MNYFRIYKYLFVCIQIGKFTISLQFFRWRFVLESSLRSVAIIKASRGSYNLCLIFVPARHICSNHTSTAASYHRFA